MTIQVGQTVKYLGETCRVLATSGPNVHKTTSVKVRFIQEPHDDDGRDDEWIAVSDLDGFDPEA